DHRRSVAVLSRGRRAAAGAGLGLDAGRRSVDADGGQLVADSLSRPLHHDGRARDAAARRLAAHPPRPAAAQSVTRAPHQMPPLLQVTDLETHYVSFGGARVIKAVDNVSFTLNQ